MGGHLVADVIAQLPQRLHGPGKLLHILGLSLLESSVVHPACEWLAEGLVGEVEGMDPAALKSSSWHGLGGMHPISDVARP